MGREIDVGSGVSYRTVTCSHSAGAPSGAIVTFQLAGEEPCEGVLTWCPDCPTREEKPWELHSLEPLHVEPSIQCTVHAHHHGFIREGKWVPA